MREHPENPGDNQIPKGISEKSLIRAIERSGYPLQGIVLECLRDRFDLAEEWCFIDRDTKDHRSLDVFARLQLPNNDYLTPSLCLLIECKRSLHPYIFFRNPVAESIPQFPRVAGLPGSATSIAQAGVSRNLETTADIILGLSELPFVRPGPTICSAFTRAVARGDKIEFSGTDPFNKMVMPLVKASDYTHELINSTSNSQHLSPTLVLAVSVIDAPILLLEDPSRPSDPVLTPWLRVVRHEAHRDSTRIRYRYHVIDIVHAGYFDVFINQHILPFSQQFEQRVNQQSGVLSRGGMVNDLDD